MTDDPRLVAYYEIEKAYVEWDLAPDEVAVDLRFIDKVSESLATAREGVYRLEHPDEASS